MGDYTRVENPSLPSRSIFTRARFLTATPNLLDFPASAHSLSRADIISPLIGYSTNLLTTTRARLRDSTSELDWPLHKPELRICNLFTAKRYCNYPRLENKQVKLTSACYGVLYLHWDSCPKLGCLSSWISRILMRKQEMQIRKLSRISTLILVSEFSLAFLRTSKWSRDANPFKYGRVTPVKWNFL